VQIFSAARGRTRQTIGQGVILPYGLAISPTGGHLIAVTDHRDRTVKIISTDPSTDGIIRYLNCMISLNLCFNHLKMTGDSAAYKCTGICRFELDGTLRFLKLRRAQLTFYLSQNECFNAPLNGLN